MSKRKDGSMKNSSFNRQKFLSQFRIDNKDTVTAGLVHGNNIKHVSKYDLGKFIKNTDSLITNEKGVFLTITTADCLPILLYDPKKEAIGLIHAGWRGLVLNIVGHTVKRMGKDFGSKAKNIIAGIGPGISVCHFEVKKDIEKKFKKYQKAIEKRNGKILIDLKKIAFLQLLEGGVKRENIEINPECTFHKEIYFSFRRDRVLPLKAQLVVMGLTK
ncbi:MAG: peptidoglycan editing factor PgeF [Candidatus Levybacteria bacterium]|nr:peptidoglycan editing factor PgeF [Candidatus Levybacteria bacterium]